MVALQVIKFLLLFAVEIIKRSFIFLQRLIELFVASPWIYGPLIIIFLVIALILGATLLAIWLTPTSLFVLFEYYFVNFLGELLLRLFIQIMNSASPLWKHIIPLIGFSQETTVISAILFYDSFCQEQSFIECSGVQPIAAGFQDILIALLMTIDILFINFNIGIDFLFSFICKFSLSNPTVAEFFCDKTSLRVDRYEGFRDLPFNSTVHLDRDMINELGTVITAITGVLRFITGPLIQYGANVARFLISLALLLLKYLSIASAIVFNLMMGLFFGIIFHIVPRDLPPTVNATGIATLPELDQQFDFMATEITQDLLLLDPIALFNESSFPCPDGFCETLQEFLEQVNDTAFVIYNEIPNILLLTDAGSCTLIYLFNCGSAFGVCRFLYGQEEDARGIFYWFFDVIWEDVLMALPIFLCELGGNEAPSDDNENTARRSLTTTTSYLYGKFGFDIFGILDTLKDIIIGNTKDIDLLKSIICTDPSKQNTPEIIALCNINGRRGIIDDIIGGAGDSIDAIAGLLDTISTGACNGIQTNNFVLSALEDSCDQLLAINSCPCFVCPIDKNKERLVFNVLNLGPTEGVPCNPFLEGADGCCLVANSTIPYYSQNCQEKEQSGYTSWFYLIYEFITLGNIDQFLLTRPFRCQPEIGYQYWFLTHEMGVITYIKSFYYALEASMNRFKYETMSSALYTRFLPFKRFNDLRFSFHALFWSYFEDDQTPDLLTEDIFFYWKALLQEHNVGCYGPDFNNYYITDFIYKCPLADAQFNVDPVVTCTLPVNPFLDTIFDAEVATIGAYAFVPSEPTFYMFASGAVGSLAGIHVTNQDAVTICPLARKAEPIAGNQLFGLTLRGNLYEKEFTLSMITQVYERYVAKNFEESFFAPNSIPASSLLREIRPSILLDILVTDSASVYELINVTIDNTELNILIANRVAILAYDNQTLFFDQFVTNADNIAFCNTIYPDTKKYSMFDYFEESHADLDWYTTIVIYQCERFINKEILQSIDGYEALFFAGNLNSASNLFLNNWTLREDINPNSDVGFFSSVLDDQLELVGKLYIVIQMMLERYFSTIMMFDIIDTVRTGVTPCDFFAIYADSSFTFTTPECDAEIEYTKPYIDFIMRITPDFWYREFTDDIGIDLNTTKTNRELSHLLFVGEIETMLKNTNDGVTTLSRYSDPFSIPSGNAFRQLTEHFIGEANSKTTEQHVISGGYNTTDAIDFCYKTDKVVHRYGLGLPFTECVLIMKALEDSVMFMADFFSHTLTVCQIIDSFITNVYDYNLLDGATTASKLGEFLDCNLVVLPRS